MVSIALTLHTISGLLAAITYVVTIVIAFNESGLLAAIIAAFVPILPQVYWFFAIGFEYGFDDQYCITVMYCVGSFVLAIIMLRIKASFEEES